MTQVSLPLVGTAHLAVPCAIRRIGGATRKARQDAGAKKAPASDEALCAPTSQEANPGCSIESNAISLVFAKSEVKKCTSPHRRQHAVVSWS